MNHNNQNILITEAKQGLRLFKMQFTTNPYPKDTHFNPNKGWKLLENTTNTWWIQLRAFPFVLINMGIIILMFWVCNITFSLDFTTLLLSFLILIPLHEFTHALTFPAPIGSSDIYLGFSVKEFVPFAAYTGSMTRKEALWNLMAPFAILSILSFGLLAFLPENSLVKHIVLFNAMASCVDSMDAFQILRRVPQSAVIKSHLDKTYWHSIDDTIENQAGQ